MGGEPDAKDQWSKAVIYISWSWPGARVGCEPESMGAQWEPSTVGACLDLGLGHFNSWASPEAGIIGAILEA